MNSIIKLIRTLVILYLMTFVFFLFATDAASPSANARSYNSSPKMMVNPSQLLSNQEADQQITKELTIQNTGDQNLTWSIGVEEGAKSPCIDGMADSYPCSNVDLFAFMPLKTIGGGEGNDIWGWADPQDGKEIAIMGRTNGTSFVDLSDPANPIYLGNLPGHNNSTSIWRDIKVYKNHAFIVSEASNHGMQIFDLTQLRNVSNPPVTFSETAHYDDFGNAHNIVINEESGFAYAVGSYQGTDCNGGLHIINIQEPTNPTYAGCFSADGYTHDAQCVIYNGSDLDHQGKEICFNANEDTLTIVDVTNKSTPSQLSRTGYIGSRYTHQGWLTEDQNYFLLDDEQDEQTDGHNTRTYIWDVSDLDNPEVIGTYTSSVAAIDHNLYVKGNYLYQANYRAGLRILDITDIANANLSEKGYFDIYPASDSPQYNGAWSSYPYFESGIVIVSGIEQGLFVLQPQLVKSPSAACDQPTDIPWLTLSQSSSKLTPGESTTINVTFDSKGLSNGTYQATLCIQSNDPDTPQQQVPLTFIIGEPSYQLYLPLIEASSASLALPAFVDGVQGLPWQRS